MQLDLTTPALLFPAIAILMLGYVNRYIGVANVIRSFAKDYLAGQKHVDLVGQLGILKRRIELLKYMLSFGATALMSSCASMLLIYTGSQNAGEIVFGGALVLMIASLVLSLYETSLSNKSLLIEIDDIAKQERA